MNQDLIILAKALQKLQSGFADFPDTLDSENQPQIESILLEVAEKMQDNYPYFRTSYVGQMLKPPHAIARLAYMLSLYINPNNHALDGGKASSALEKEAVQKIARMFGWEKALGHLTGGGTMANLEALWVAGKTHPGKKVVASAQSHYTHERISGVLGLGFQKVGCDQAGRMDMQELEKHLVREEIGTVVVTLGSTGTGSVDPLVDVLELQKKYSFRIHVDAAYGGYFGLLDNLSPEATAHYQAIPRADSLVIDPHKHGLQPYGCGCILFKNPEDGRFYRHDSPYTYFTSAELHLGEISLECSRAGAAAVALWATLKLFPLEKGGAFARELAKSREAATKLAALIRESTDFKLLFEPETDIVVWAPNGDNLNNINQTSRRIFSRVAKEYDLHLALINYPVSDLPDTWEFNHPDQPYITCLRSCLMKPTHVDFVETMWTQIQAVL